MYSSKSTAKSYITEVAVWMVYGDYGTFGVVLAFACPVFDVCDVCQCVPATFLRAMVARVLVKSVGETLNTQVRTVTYAHAAFCARS